MVKCTMNYIGSKFKLLPFIDDVVAGLRGKPGVICDLFGGTHIVGRHFRSNGWNVISNDMEIYSHAIAKAYIESPSHPEGSEDVIAMLNNLRPVAGFIFEEYSEGGKSERLYFSEANGKKIDAIRQRLSSLPESDFYYYIVSLLEASDRVANVASVYGAFLKQLKKSALKDLSLSLLPLSEGPMGHVYRRSANDLIKEISGDVLYLDPPYNSRQYGPNYHLLNTIVEYEPFIPKGKTGLREYERSDYCKKSQATEALRDVIESAQFNYIVLSYNNEGIIPLGEIESMMSKCGEYSVKQVDYSRFKADAQREHNADHTIEYLHILKK